MPSDILLNDGEDKNWVTVEGTVLNHKGSDLIIDADAHRKSDRGFRRALVHDRNDGLTINFNGDYPGGVTLHDLRNLNLRPVGVLGRFRLPRRARPGDIIVVHYMKQVFMPPFTVEATMVAPSMDDPETDWSPFITSPETDREIVEWTPDGIDTVMADTHPYRPGEIDTAVIVSDSPVPDNSYTLWLCVGLDDDDSALWSQVPLGAPIRGTR